MSRNSRYGAIIALMAGLAVLLSGCAGFGSGPTANVVTTKTTTTPTSSASPTGTPTGQPCPTEFVQAFDPNKAGRFYSNGFETSAEDLEYLGHDARTLAFRAFSIGQLTELKLVKTPDPAELLEPGGKCLSREGQDIYLQVKAAHLSAEIDENGQAPATGYNTAMQDGVAGIDADPGVGGDRSAVVYTFKNGNKLYVMKRCGNIVFVTEITELPTVPTENLRPSCPDDMPHGVWPVCKDDPNRDFLAQGNAPEQDRGVAPAAESTASAPDVAKTSTSKYTQQPSPAPKPIPRPTPPPTAEPSTPPTSAPDPSPTVNNCEVNPDFCAP